MIILLIVFFEGRLDSDIKDSISFIVKVYVDFVVLINIGFTYLRYKYKDR